MFKEFFIKRTLNNKGVPKEQLAPLMAVIKKNPALFQQIAMEVEEKAKKENKDHLAATMEVIAKHREELEKILKDKI